ELLKEVLGNTVVEDAFAFDLVVLFVVEGGGVVLEMLDEGAGLWPFVQNLGLAFVNAAAPVHATFLLSDGLDEADNPPMRGASSQETALPRFSQFALRRNQPKGRANLSVWGGGLQRPP